MADFVPSVNIFHHHEFGDLRVVVRGGEQWFVARDVCRALDLGNITEALRGLDSDERGSELLNTPGGRQALATVSEPGLYSLVLRSYKPEAKPFKRWVTHEVLPSIRRHRAYMTPDKVAELLDDPDTMIRLLTDLKAEREQRRRLAAQVQANEPKVLFARAVEGSDSDINIGELAKILRQNGVDTGQNRLFEALHERGYLMRRGGQWIPTQRSMDLQVMRLKETVVSVPDKEPIVRLTTKVTGKGQVYFLDRFRSLATCEGAA